MTKDELRILRAVAAGRAFWRPGQKDTPVTLRLIKKGLVEWVENTLPPMWRLTEAGRQARAAVVSKERADLRLPCDVSLPPATILRAGVPLSTLLKALEARGMPKALLSRKMEAGE